MLGRLEVNPLSLVIDFSDLSIDGRGDKILSRIIRRIIVRTYQLQIMNVALIMR